MHRIRIAYLISFFLNVAIALGQAPDTAWTRTYGGSADDWAYSVQQTFDHGYVIGGYTCSFGAGEHDLYLVRVDEHGDTLWTHTYGGSAMDIGYSVKQITDGGYIFAGSTTSYGAGGMDIYLVRTNNNGDTLWTRTFGSGSDDIGFTVIETQDGHFVIVGITYSYGVQGDVYLIKVNSDGVLLWQKTYGGINRDGAFSVTETDDGELLVTGVTSSYGAGGDDMWLLRLNTDGDTVWTKVHGNERDQAALCVNATSDRGCIIAGYGYWELLGDEMVVLRLDELGDTVWRHCNGSLNDDCAYAAAELTNDRGCIIAGNFSYDAFVIRTDTLGSVVWTQMYGGAGIDCAYEIKETYDHGYIIVGITDSYGSGGYDIYLIKILADTLASYEDDKHMPNQGYMTIHPHPASDRCRLSYWVSQPGISTISLFNCVGEHIFDSVYSHSISGSHTLDLDVETLPSGIYFLRYTDMTSTTCTKFVLIK